MLSAATSAQHAVAGRIRSSKVGAARRLPLRCYSQRRTQTSLDESLDNNPLFTDSLRTAFREALNRQGDSSLSLDVDEEFREDRSQEQILMATLDSSRKSLQQLKNLQLMVRLAVEREERQVQRMEFALDKARKDQAYYNTLERMFRQQNQ